jgi:hypothetical protein
MKVACCQPYAPAAFTLQEISLLLISVRGLVDPMAIVRPKWLSQRKNRMTPSGIDPATCRLASVNYATVYAVPLMDVSKIWQQ